MARRLEALSIRNFRAIDELKIPEVTDINLIVGKNSTGKTTILEAIRLLLVGDLRPKLYSLLSDREEYTFGRRENFNRALASSGGDLAFNTLFWGRPELSEQCHFEIDGGPSGPFLEVRFVWLRVERGSDASIRYIPSPTPDTEPDTVPGFTFNRMEGIQAVLPLDRINRVINRRALRDDIEGDIVFLPSSGMSMDEIGRLWDSVALTDDEDDVVDALRIIAPNLEKLVMVQSPDSRSDRMLMAKVSQFRGPIPFKSLGEGAGHLLSIALALIKARGGALLIDEIATGIHYSVQPTLWEMISRQSSRYKIQVFATTHSLDCVRALRSADQVPSGAVPSLFRIEKTDFGLRAVTFSSEEIHVIDEEEIEVR
ncbi:AAA family ATPase [Methylobacterium gossipiicola]|uniref:ATPase/GTPase, AAA15 family n=1 Tax=Methylobacterium gossipiicola TaxID=582675 RepID=A0A1I2VWI5_9HYPH|nr:ATP-binding protein [Methylobacterium gossipiicola]SFG93483.1 ATPase/GTPase, AAA15 family [Methylobacterium gossipiicola]